MAESVFSSPNGEVLSSVTQIPSVEQTGKEPIQAQSQSARRFKRNRAVAYATPSVDEKGREMLVCNFCHSVIRVGGEIASSEKETSEVHLTVLEEGKEEIPSRIVKRRTLSDGKEDLLGLLAKIDEDKLGIEGMIQLRTAKEALKEYFKVRDTSTQRDL